jgi:predicted MFS family arabinose efflux permease
VTVAAHELYSRARQRGFLLILFLVGTSNYADRLVLSVLLELIKQEFGASDTMMGLLTGLAFAVLYATLGIPVASWADRGNRPLIMTLALTVWSVMTMAGAFAMSFWQLVLARVGVGIGEAGAIPPAHSLIGDYFAPEGRARALAVFSLSSTAGYAIAAIGGGWIAEHYGWRMTFIVIGLPGLLLAIATKLLLPEPRKDRVAEAGRLSAIESMSELWRKPSYRWLLTAMVLYFLVAYGAFVFVPAFLVRAHAMSVADAGAAFGLVNVIGTLAGTYGFAALLDRLARRNALWLTRLPALLAVMTLPALMGSFLAQGTTAMLVLLTAASTLIAGVGPALFAAIHHVCGNRRRAMAIALVFLFANLIGLGLGPVATGFISDLLTPRVGEADALRYALALMSSFLLMCAATLARAGVNLVADTEA